MEGSIIISWSISSKDSAVVLVGEQKNGKMNVINAFNGQEAEDIYENIIKGKLKNKREDY